MVAQIALFMLNTSQTIPKFCRDGGSLAAIHLWYQTSHNSAESLSLDTARARDTSGNKRSVCSTYNNNGCFSSIGAIFMAKEVPTTESLVCSMGQKGGML